VATPQASLALDEPLLRIQTATVYASKGNATWTGTGGPAGYSPDFGQFGDIISSAGLAQEPFADRLSGIDASDDVTFVIAVENTTPGARAYSPTIRATMPSGFVLPDGGASITVTNGAGTPLAYSGDLFDPQGGLTLDAKAPLAGYDAGSGLNILVVSYTLSTADQLDLSVPVHDSTAQIVSYATQPGWANRALLAPAADNTATTEVATILPAVKIALAATSDPSTAGTLLALGETATLDLTATLPEGMSRALNIGPVLPSGFTAVSARVVSVGANITPQTQAADGAGGITFGDTLNAADGQDTAADQIQIEVIVRPTRAPDGPAPHSVPLQGMVSIGAPGAAIKAVDSVALVVADPVPPVVTLALAGPGAATLLNGQTATFRVTVALPVGMSTDFHILDILPTGLAYVTGSARVVQAGGVASVGGAALPAPSASVAGPLLTLDFGAVNAPKSSGQVVIEFQARLLPAVPGTTLVNSVAASTGYAASAPATLAALVGNTPPTLTGLPIAEAAQDDTALAAFASIGLADPDAGPNTGQAQTLKIKLSNPANGTLANLGAGSYDPAMGVYTVTGTLADVTAAAAALRFIPTRHQANLGQTVPTDLSVQAQDSAGGMSPTLVIRVTAAATNTAPTVRNAAPGQPLTPGVPVRLFTGLLLQDADAGQSETLTIQFSDPAIGTLSGAGPGHIDPATGAFTSTGTLAALMAEAGRLLFTAGQSAATGAAAAGAAAAEAFETITINDGAGGIARDISVIVTSAGALPTPPGLPAVPQLFTGPPPANSVIVNPASANLLTGTNGRDAYFIDGNASGSHWDTLIGFTGADTVVLWGFEPGRSVLTWLDSDGPPGHAGRTLRVSIPGTGGTNSLTFAGLAASDTNRFAISAGRFNGLGYLSITAPP